MKVLVANRGAIAVRICRTLKRMGIPSVVVFTQADAESEHVSCGDEAVPLGADPKAYLNGQALIDAALAVKATAVHPGYGFLSENAEFAELCATNHVVFIGPTPEQMRQFGLKHRARELAIAQQVPVCQGSALLADVDHAKAEAERIGYPVMLKSTGGGGGIGMKPAHTESELVNAFESVKRTAASSFKDAGVFVEQFVEHARHIEVQVFGNGSTVVALGERDCSTQRRNQKVLEECPAPNLPAATRQALFDAATALCGSVGYRNAGTVEFIVDADDPARFFFLEVNTRLQVEHGVTEQVLGIDLVEWMVALAQGTFAFPAPLPSPRGWSVQARVYAEDPNKDFMPNTGTLTLAAFPGPDVARVETWVVAGTPVSAFYDPMLAKVIVTADTRDGAVAAMRVALEQTRLCGIETNVEYLAHIVASEAFARGRMTTRFLSTFAYAPRTVDVVEPGTQTSVQDYPGRLGYWAVGVPPSGPMDALALRTANRVVGNDDASAGLEVTIVGPVLRFNSDAVVCVTGADLQAEIDGSPVPLYASTAVAAGAVLKFKGLRGPGCRCYVAFGGGGLDVPEYMGCKSTFALGNFGGHAGRCLKAGDVLKLPRRACAFVSRVASPKVVPTLDRHWRIGVLLGPQPDYLAPAFVDNELFRQGAWKVHFNSNRLGIRLSGPTPQWARRDGGEAGLHPSNIHDNEYAIGSVNFTGDTAVILGLDGPSLGGFICPITVVKAELWKVGQLFPGDTVTFVRQTYANAAEAERRVELALQAVTNPPAALFDLGGTSSAPTHFDAERGDGFMLYARPASGASRPAMEVRQAGDYHVLVEYGPQELDLVMRFRIHALMQALERSKTPGVDELSPGVRSLQIRFGRAIPLAALVALLVELDVALPAAHEMTVQSRVVSLPLAFNCSTTKKALDTYMRTVKSEAPWLPSNVEFIRRINGLGAVDDVASTIYSASYLVLGLGDVYLGAPCAVPLDPRTRLVTTKFNPARTWTAEGEVGIGGVYMCIYGMESPGGYQLVGRTVPVWSSHRRTRSFDKPWLLRFFDQVRFYAMDEAELDAFRSDFRRGKTDIRVENVEFNVAAYLAQLAADKPAIDAFKHSQRDAFEAEVERWQALQAPAEDAAQGRDRPHAHAASSSLPPGAQSVASHVSGALWAVHAKPGDVVAKGQALAVVQAMKMELSVLAPRAGKVLALSAKPGDAVESGDALLVLGALPMDAVALQGAYKAGVLTPAAVVEYLYDDAPGELWTRAHHAFIHRVSKRALLDRVAHTQPSQPLYGLFFAAKDNIDVAGLPTTAACPAFSHVPARSATVVELLEAAGAVCVGKTNMDQFALGLVGVRSPYGACSCVFNDKFVSGGSSSGSAVLTALGLCSFALGTDTAGSGRVPAAFNCLVGWKPTRGMVSNRGVLPACQSLDCVSVFATSCADCALVKSVVARFDAEDVYSRRLLGASQPAKLCRLGVPLAIDCDAVTERCWQHCVAQLRGALASELEFVPVDVSSMVAAAAMLYGGPFVAERRTPLSDFLQHNSDHVHAVTKAILDGAEEHTAEALFAAEHKLMELRRQADVDVWARCDALLLPTAPAAFTIADVVKSPFALNSVLGRYTNFVNLMDLAAVAVPGVMRPDGVGFGVTLVGATGSDDALLTLAAAMHAASGLGAGITTTSVPAAAAAAEPAGRSDDADDNGMARLVVAGAHLRGMALNHQLVERGGVFEREASTAPVYRMYALPDGRPGLVRESSGGSAFAVEVWRLPLAGLGSFVATCVAPPLCLGTVELDDGARVTGFLCEAFAVKAATDISAFGGFRAYKAAAADTSRKRKQDDV